MNAKKLQDNNIVQVFKPNIKGRDFVVGDIHGSYDLLLDELENVQFDTSKDRLFSVGDLVDRGEKSFDCISLLLQPWFHAVRGNHEDMMVGQLGLKPYERVSKYDWYLNGGDWFEECPPFTPELKQAIADMPLVIVVKKFDGTRVNIVHAEFLEYTSDEQIDNGELGSPGNLMWQRRRGNHARKLAKNSDYLVNTDYTAMDVGLSRTFVGHTVVNRPVKLGSYNFIDTGAVFDGALTILQI